jgi:hypothetical protein
MREFFFMNRVAPALIILAALVSIGFAQSVPRFSAFPATVEKARAKAIDFKKNPDARTFRTRLSEALRRGVDFAGHYVVAGWGCGTGCILGAIIDARTGNVFWPEQLSALGVLFSGGEYANEPVAYRKKSRMLVISGVPGQANDDAPEKPSGIYYYEWKNNRLRQIKFVPKAME